MCGLAGLRAWQRWHRCRGLQSASVASVPRALARPCPPPPSSNLAPSILDPSRPPAASRQTCLHPPRSLARRPQHHLTLSLQHPARRSPTDLTDAHPSTTVPFVDCTIEPNSSVCLAHTPDPHPHDSPSHSFTTFAFESRLPAAPHRTPTDDAPLPPVPLPFQLSFTFFHYDSYSPS